MEWASKRVHSRFLFGNPCSHPVKYIRLTAKSQPSQVWQTFKRTLTNPNFLSNSLCILHHFLIFNLKWLMFLNLVGKTYDTTQRWAISTTSRARNATGETKEWDEEAWSLACLWCSTGLFLQILHRFKSFYHKKKLVNHLFIWVLRLWVECLYQHAAGQCLYDRLKLFPGLLSPPARSVRRTNGRVMNCMPGKTAVNFPVLRMEGSWTVCQVRLLLISYCYEIWLVSCSLNLDNSIETNGTQTSVWSFLKWGFLITPS